MWRGGVEGSESLWNDAYLASVGALGWVVASARRCSAAGPPGCHFHALAHAFPLKSWVCLLCQEAWTYPSRRSSADLEQTLEICSARLGNNSLLLFSQSASLFSCPRKSFYAIIIYDSRFLYRATAGKK